MKPRMVRLGRRVAVELLLLLLTVGVAVRLGAAGHPGWALAALAAGGLASGLGIAIAWRAGELAMAWRCPRLDALALRAGALDAPWSVLVAADSALAALQGAGSYREFFPEARRHLVQSAFRALAAHHLAGRARAALVDAPEGEARARLEAQEALALRELDNLTHALRDLKARFVAASAPLPIGEAPPELRELGEQSLLLARSIDELHRAPESVPVPGGL
ncbi:MAG: hypothetical protein HY901_09400 [Deltaproteobacteria bacterium]|nr:hypothetical protein [Deltaproteobacteria bacterium]